MTTTPLNQTLANLIRKRREGELPVPTLKEYTKRHQLDLDTYVRAESGDESLSIGAYSKIIEVTGCSLSEAEDSRLSSNSVVLFMENPAQANIALQKLKTAGKVIVDLVGKHDYDSLSLLAKLTIHGNPVQLRNEKGDVKSLVRIGTNSVEEDVSRELEGYSLYSAPHEGK